MTDFNLELKQIIIDTLDLEDIEPADIVDDEPLFVDGLGLDSIDALEIGLMLQVHYGITLKADNEETRQHFTSVNALAALVQSHRQQQESA
ncbi:MAG: acyl carrier protein [Gammaproteobacteria bacterium]|nr:acyl carrier protein [Gammaproteobacteria bacterium]